MSAPAAPVVIADDLTIRYESGRGSTLDAVSGVSFELAKGELLAVIGETGSGKSTLAKTVAGFASGGQRGPRISGGDLSVLGHRMRGISQRKRAMVTLAVGYVPQDAGSYLQPRFTVAENVAEPIFSRDRDFDRREAGQAVAMGLDAVRLPMTSMNRFPHELSRGQRQRVAIAKALILDPLLLVADDPTAGIDVAVRGTILDIIRDLQRDRSLSTLLVSQSMSEVRRFGQRVAVMHRGSIVAVGTADDILDSRHPYVEGLARAMQEPRPAEDLDVS